MYQFSLLDENRFQNERTGQLHTEIYAGSRDFFMQLPCCKVPDCLFLRVDNLQSFFIGLFADRFS